MRLAPSRYPHSHRPATRALVVALLWLAALGAAGLARIPPLYADECASYGPAGHLDSPTDGAVVPRNVRFRIGLWSTCGGVEGGPAHVFRILAATGAEVPFDTVAWMSETIELVPRAPLAPGAATLEVRRPISIEALGPWERLTTVKVTAALDEVAPRFAGLKRAVAKRVKGSILMTPCEAEDAFVIETRFHFDAATDPSTDHDLLLYVLERRAPTGATWELVSVFRPTPEGGARMRFTETSERGWGETWTYRLRVRDVAGHETIGAATADVRAPKAR